jgi:hypothetical protein
MGVSGLRHYPIALYPGKGSPVTIEHEAGWATEPVWTQRLAEKSFMSAGDRTWISRLSSPSPDTILTEQPRLPFIRIAERKRRVRCIVDPLLAQQILGTTQVVLMPCPQCP